MRFRYPLSIAIALFAIKAHVRQVSDMMPSSTVESGDNGELAVRTIVYAEDEIENAATDVWEMTADGTPFLKSLTTNYVDPG